MGARWVAAVVLVSALAWGEELATPADPAPPPQSQPSLRTFIGGFTSGALAAQVISPWGSFWIVGPIGVAFDVGSQLSPTWSLSAQARLSTFVQFNHLQVAGSLEWSRGSFSAGLGLGGAVLVSVNPAQGLTYLTAFSVPLVLGITAGEQRASMGLRSTRINFEVALLVAPFVVGGTIGISVGSLRR